MRGLDAALLRVAEDLLDEEVVGAGVGAGAKMAIFSSGKLGSTWFQVVAPPSLKIMASCSKLRHSRNSFSAEVTTASPSRPTRNS